MLKATADTSGYAVWEATCTFRAFLEGFCLLANNDTFGYVLPIEDSFNLFLQMMIAGMKELEGNFMYYLLTARLF